jgi:hypothetical protein
MASTSQDSILIQDIIEYYDFHPEFCNRVYSGTILKKQVYNKKTKEKFMKQYEKNKSNTSKYQDRCVDLKERLRKKLLEKN